MGHITTSFELLVSEEFTSRFKEEPSIFRAPGRVNLIGEHTDYNLGFVLPASVDKAIVFGISKRSDQVFCFHSIDMDDYCECHLQDLKPSAEHPWANYLMGVVDQFLQRGYSPCGLNVVFGGNIPVGSGLSSSAALECGLAYAINKLCGYGLDALTLVKMSQAAEHEFVGVRCGIMDQFASMLGQEGKVIRLDCRSLQYHYFPFDFPDVKIALVDSQVSHSLASSEYNKRREECEAGVEALKKHYPEIESLRDVQLEQLREHQSELDSTVFKRCEYVLEENQRLLDACEALSSQDIATFGEKMYGSHHGLQHKYEVSCPELDWLVDQTRDNPHVYGSRMMGGGFGGCTINLVKGDYLATFEAEMEEAFRKKYGKPARIFKTEIQAGVEQVA